MDDNWGKYVVNIVLRNYWLGFGQIKVFNLIIKLDKAMIRGCEENSLFSI